MRVKYCVGAAIAALVSLLCLFVASATANNFNVETHALYILQPSQIAGNYEAAMADFGVPLYGGSLHGQVLMPKNSGQGCDKYSPEAYAQIKRASSSKPVIVLVERGGCYFVKKAFHAQQAGAAAILISDTRVEPLMTMLTPQDSEDAQALVSEIEIPSALVTKKLGDQMKGVLGGDAATSSTSEMLLIELNWEQSMVNPDDRVEWEFYTTSNDECGSSCKQQAKFKISTAAVAMQLERQNFTAFTPHYKIRGCDENFEGGCDQKCLHNGRYCPSDEHIVYPFNETFSEYDIMLENKRELCIFDYLKRAGQPELWWQYVSDYAKRCTIKRGTFGEDCSRQQQKRLLRRKKKNESKKGSDLNSLLDDVRKCMGNSRADETHPLLEQEINYEMERFQAGLGHIDYLPSVFINTIQYRGRLDRAAVLRGICAGFEETSEPAVCLQSTIQTNECDESENACWTHDDPSIAETLSSTCVDTFRGHICVCPQGYMGDGYTCEEMNECSLGLHECDHKCVNTQGGYTCECYEGFAKMGETKCILSNQCAVNNGGCDHGCKWTTHGHQCFCREGYALGKDGKTCLDVDECAGDHGCDQLCINANPKHSGGLSYVCGCNEGYTLDLSDPLLRRCVKSKDLLKSLGVDSKQHSNAYSALEVALIIVLSVFVVFLLGFALYKWRFRKRMDKEIRSILEQYVPLPEKPEGKKSAFQANSSSSTKDAGKDLTGENESNATKVFGSVS
jgi:hypothetical protein